MLLLLSLIVSTRLHGVKSYSIFGGNAYGYTGASWCAAYNGCMAQIAEDKETGKPLYDSTTSGGLTSAAGTEGCKLRERDRAITMRAPTIMQINHYGERGRDLDQLKDFFDRCLNDKLSYFYFLMNPEPNDCTKIKGDKILRKRIDEIFKFQVLTDNSVLENVQGSVWRWLGGTKNKEQLFDINQNCNDEECKSALRQTCQKTYHIRHVRDWCFDIVKWIFSNDDFDTYQQYILKVVLRVVADKTYASYEEQAVLVASAASTVFITKNMFDGIDQLPYMRNLPYYAIHSLLLASYAGRLRITLQPRDKGWNGGGVSVTASSSSIEAAKNFEGFTGSVYASLAALFHNEGNDKLKLRFRPEIHEQNGIGCIEQTVGMVFIRPGDWVPDQVTWISIGASQFSPAGMMAVNKGEGKESTLEISEGGLNLYPVTIGDVLVSKKASVCNSRNTRGNGKAEHSGFNLRGLGGICNWVPTWGPNENEVAKLGRKSEVMDPEIEEEVEEEREEEEDDDDENDEEKPEENPNNARTGYTPRKGSFENSSPEPKQHVYKVKKAFVKTMKKFSENMQRLSARLGNLRRSKFAQMKRQHKRNKQQWNRFRDVTRHKLTQVQAKVGGAKEAASLRANKVMASASNSIKNFKASGRAMVNNIRGTTGKYLGSNNPVTPVFPFIFMG